MVMQASALQEADEEDLRLPPYLHLVSLAAGVSLFSLSRRMGTSVRMIDKTYGHLAPDAEASELALLNAL